MGTRDVNSGDSVSRDGVYSPNDRSYHLGRDSRERKIVPAAALGSTEALEVRWWKWTERSARKGRETCTGVLP